MYVMVPEFLSQMEFHFVFVVLLGGGGGQCMLRFRQITCNPSVLLVKQALGDIVFCLVVSVTGGQSDFVRNFRANGIVTVETNQGMNTCSLQ